jgi:hypothetical protein
MFFFSNSLIFFNERPFFWFTAFTVSLPVALPGLSLLSGSQFNCRQQARYWKVTTSFPHNPFGCCGCQGRRWRGALICNGNFCPFLSWQASENFTSWPVFHCHGHQGHPSDFTTDLHLHHVIKCLRSVLLHPHTPRI